MKPIVIMKTNPDDFPIMWLSISDPKMPIQDLMVFVRDHIRDQLTTVPGVGSLWTPGYLEPNLRVWVKTDRLKQYALTVSDIVSTIQTEHLEPPAGRVEYSQQEFNIRTMGEAKSASQFREISINSRGGMPNFRPIPLKEVTRIEEGTEDILQFARSKGRSAVGIGVVKQRGSNAVQVALAVKKRILEIKKNIPKGTEVHINFDSTLFIEESVAELTLTLVLAAVLTSLVCWLFLGSWTSTLNILLAIPTSIVGSFIILYFCGFTLNLFTLLGLSLAIGIVVDDAIMVLENIIRHREMGKSRMDAAVSGSREITFAAIAATVSIIAIFFPIALMKGIIGQFLYQFGITMSAAVLLSLLEALTLTPMRASRFVESGHRTTRLGKGFEAVISWIHNLYVRTLIFSLNHKWKVLLSSFIFFILSFGVVGKLNKEFQPAQDQSNLMILLKNPVGSSIAVTDEKLKIIEKYLLARPEVDTTFAAAGGFTGGEVNTAILFVTMKPKGKRGKDTKLGHEPSQQEFIQIVRDYLVQAVPTANPIVQDPSLSGFGASKGFPVEFTVQGPDWEKLAGYVKQMLKELQNTGLVTDLDSDYQEGAPEIQVLPSRQKGAGHGVSINAVGQTVNAALGGVVAGRYLKSGHRYDIRVKLDENGDSPIERLKTLQVRNNRGELVPLISVVDIEKKPAAAQISRKNRQRAITVTANIAPGKSQQDALEAAQKIAHEVLPQGYQVVMSGSAEEFNESFQGLFFALGMGLIVAYMVLASQFNSYIDPITVFMALPFSFSGAFLGLWLGHQSLNIFSMIGLVLLMGITKKNSILLVDFTNQKRDQEHLPVHEALIQACPTRLRPILMTSIATIVGAIPAALSIGPGAESRAPMSVAVIGGVIVSTFLTLYVVPCVYSFFAKFDRREKLQT
jgi:HAE1 family hydrophobic/amphiphilic exporter-1